MSNVVGRLRGAVQKLRRTPMPIGDVAPMLHEAADLIESLAAENKVLRKALNAAGQSLATVAMLAGRKTYGMPPIETFMTTHEEVRAYASARSAVALAALTKEATNG